MSLTQPSAGFKPRCMATALGTVPAMDPNTACRMMFASFPEAPCVPRLGISYRRYADGMPCLRIDPAAKRMSYDPTATLELEEFYEHYLAEDLDYFAMNPAESPGFETFLGWLEGSRNPQLKMIHVGIIGPLTWSLSLSHYQSGQPAWYDETMREVVIRLLAMKAKWQQQRIREIQPDARILLSVAEPSLAIAHSAFGGVTASEALQAVDQLFDRVDCISELHCCSNTDWGLLMRSRVQVINFDAYRYAERIALYPGEVKKFLGCGGILAWGIVPVNADDLENETAARLMNRLEIAVERLAAAGIDREALLEQSIITPCCDAGALSPALTERAWKLTGDIAAALRQRHLGMA